MDDFQAAVVAEIDRLQANGPVTLVGHSMSGGVVTRVAEAVPGKLRRIVYVSAFCPTKQASIGALLGLPENASATALNAIVLGDPSATGAIRINPRSADPAYLDGARKTFYNDMTLADAQPFITLCTPDLTLRAATDPVVVSAANWGRVPRTFVRCLQDQAIPLALQDRMIAEGDALAPAQRFQVLTLDSSHSPFASQPDALANALAALA
jgi:pimeloyl-ACP methyl ester carboxylesterase